MERHPANTRNYKTSIAPLLQNHSRYRTTCAGLPAYCAANFLPVPTACKPCGSEKSPSNAPAPGSKRRSLACIGFFRPALTPVPVCGNSPASHDKSSQKQR